VGSGLTDERTALYLDGSPAIRPLAHAVSELERQTLSAQGMEGVVLRYGSFYGPGAAEQLLDLVRKRKLPTVGSGGGIWSWIHTDDAAAATVAALEKGAGVYNIVDDEPAPVAEWLPYLADVLGAQPPRRVPVWLGRLVAGEVAVSAMTKIRGSSNAKAKRELGWQPTWSSWRDGFRQDLGTTTAQSQSPEPSA
jgi:nucleoside-diphosphate-sugar epimerase